MLDNDLPSTSNGVGSQNQLGIDSPYPLAKLLKGVEKSYDKGKKLLEESKKRSADLREQRVYHGSGADFEAFDHRHMGEGQGSQVFGWGTYVTSSKAIGESYAESSFRTGGMEYTGDALTADEASLVGSLFISGMSSYHEVEEFLEKSANSDKPGAKRSANALALLRKTKPEEWKLPQQGKGQLYTVEIPEDNGSNYLDWENPLNDAQKEILKEGLMAAGVNVEFFKGFGFTLDSSFKYVYSASLPMMLRGVHVGKADNVKEKVSRFLSGLGFTGIKYPAGTIHGGAEKGDMNYVIFNEKDAKITDHVRFFRTANGEAYGFTVGGKIYVDPRIATSETPVHEYAHLWASALRSGNAEEWQNVVGLMKDSKVWDEVKGRYPELKTDDEIADEVIATYSGRRGAERLREEQRKIAEGDGGVFEKAEAISALEHVKRALKMFWKGVADFLHIHYKSAEEVADRVMKDLLEGVDPRKMGEDVDRQRYASLGVSRSLGEREDMVRYQFIGEKGAAEADHAEEVSVRLDNLSVAREMEAEKKDAKVIKMATGWERGADGKWRYEIADLKEFDRNGNLLYRKHHPDYARYIELQDKDLKNLLEDGEKLTDKEREEYEALSKKYESDKFGGEKLDNIHTLEAYVDAPELFKAYPELRNVTRTFKDTGGWETASYYAISDVIDFNVDDVGEIVVNTGKVTANMRTKELKSVFLHEIQHAIQVIEGFAEGGSPQYMKGLYSDYFLQDYSSSQLHELAELRRIAEGKVKRGEYKRMSYAVKNVIKAAKEHGFYPTWAESFDNNPNSVTTVYDTLVKFPSEILDKAVLIDERDLYNRVAGEVEARNVQERMGMSAEERRASLAAETEDVAREDQIFLMGDGVSNQQTLRNVNNQSLFDAIHTLYSKGKAFASQLFNMKFFDVAETPDFMKRLGLTGDKFTIRYGVISRHFGKDNQHDFTEEEWKQIPKALSNPILITEYYQDEQQKRQKGYRLYTPLKLADGSYVVVSAEVKNAGKNLEINAINTIFGRNAISDIHDRIIYQNPKITPEQSSLLNGNNPHQYPTGQELSDANVDNSSETAKESEEKDRQRYASIGVSMSLGEEAAEGEPRWASLGLSEQQLDGDDTIRFSLNYDKWDREMASWLKRNRLPKNAQRPVVPQREAGESDLHFAGRLAKYNQDKALWNTAPKYEGHLSSGMTARGEFNYELQRGAVLKRIAIQDSMLAIRKAQEVIARHSGLLKVGTFEDAYMAENNSHGKAKDRLKVTIVDAEGNVTNRVMKRGNVQVDGRMSAEDFRNAYEEAVSSRMAPEADINEQENNVDEEGVVAGGAAPSADTAATSGEEGAASEPAVRDKNGNPIYDKMPISATIADLYDGALDDAAQTAYRNGSDAAAYGAREVTAEFMQSGDVKITPESYRKETGFGAAEQRAMVGKISKGGKSIDKLAEDLEVFDRENYNGMYFGGDSSVAKDAILDYLSSPDSRKGVKKMQSEAEREYVEAYEAERDRYYQEKYHMSYEEYLVYSSQEMPELLRKYSNFDEQLFLERYADEIEAALQKREEQLKQEENGKEGNVSAGEESGHGRSNQVQSGERTDDTGRGEVGKDSAGEVGPRHEGVVESEAASKETITPEQQSLLSRPNSSQYTAERESSDHKATNNTDTKQENEEKSAKALSNKQSSGQAKMSHKEKTGEKEAMSPTTAMIDRMIEEQRVDDVSELLISSELKKAAEGIAGAFGMKVVYLKKVFIRSNDPAVEDFEGNGFVRNGVIYLSLKEADIAQFTFGHELLHQLKQIDADSYMRIRQKVIAVMGRKAFEMEVKARQMTYANVPGYTLFEDYAEEVIADTLGDIITHTDMLPNIARSLKENPSLLDRFLKVVDNVRQYFRGKTGGALGDLVNDIRNTYEMTARQGAETNRTEAALDAVNDRFNDRLESLVANPNQKDKVLRLGRSSEFLRNGGLADAEIVLEFDKLARKSKEGYKNEHPFDMSDIKDLPIAISSPIAVFDNTNGKNDGRVILTELTKDGRNFIVAVKASTQRRKGGVVLEVNQITSLFPKDAKGIVHWFNGSADFSGW